MLKMINCGCWKRLCLCILSMAVDIYNYFFFLGTQNSQLILSARISKTGWPDDDSQHSGISRCHLPTPPTKHLVSYQHTRSYKA